MKTWLARAALALSLPAAVAPLGCETAGGATCAKIYVECGQQLQLRGLVVSRQRCPEALEQLSSDGLSERLLDCIQQASCDAWPSCVE